MAPAQEFCGTHNVSKGTLVHAATPQNGYLAVPGIREELEYLRLRGLQAPETRPGECVSV